MARKSDLNVGDTVYHSFQPQKPGIVIERGSRLCTVLWADGLVTNEGDPKRKKMDGTTFDAEPWLASFDVLVEEHRRKAEKFDALRKSLRGRVAEHLGKVK